MAFRAVQNVGNQWVPEIKRLNDNLVKLEESLAGTDECVMDIYALEEKLNDRMSLLEEELNAVKAENVEMREELDAVKAENVEMREELDAVKAENVEMRCHFNAMIKELNAVTHFVNEKYGYNVINTTYNIDEPPK